MNPSEPRRSLRRRLAPALLLGLVAAFAAPASAQAIQLRDGQLLVGEVVDATTDGLSFRRLDNGGLLELSWSDLSPLHAEQIKRLEGIVVEEEGEVTIEADVLIYKTGGGSLDEVVGLIVEYAPDKILLKQKNRIVPVPTSAIAKPPRTREVPVLEIFTADEYYQRKLAEIQPGEDADKHVALAEELRRVRLYEESLKHLERAEELGGGKHSGQLTAMLERVRRLKESAAERGLLAEIRIQRNRRNFERAAELIEQFEQEYPESELARELDREKKRFDENRETYLLEEIKTRWASTVREVARVKAGERDSSLTAVRSWVEDGMAEEVFDRIGRVLEIEPKEVAELWAKRLELSNPRADLYSYGVGSWVLGADAVTKDTDAGAGGGNDSGSGSAQDRELERLIRKLREVRERGRAIAARRDTGQQQTEDDWWEDAERNERTGWIRAYFAEYSGRMEVTSAYAFKCPNCDGAGYLVTVGSSGEEQRAKCPTCQGTRFTRAIRAR